MHRRTRRTRRTRLAAPALALALATLAAGCDRPLPTADAPDERTQPSLGALVPAANGPHRAPLERLARRVARAMADPAFRTAVKAELDQSPFTERKVHFQRFLRGADRRALRDVARLNGETEQAVEADLDAAVALEMYLPVPRHRAAWRGDDDLLVATALADGETPVAYDLRGRRQMLSAEAPPTTPVLALVPVETDFDQVNPSASTACAGQFAISASCTSTGTYTSVTPGLYMSKSQLRETFEGWLKGDPEIEILVLGQKGATDSLTKYQCIGQRALGAYYFDQNSTGWTGNVLLFSQTQLDDYKAQHPGQAVRLFFMEDDDTSCELRNNNASVQSLIGTVDQITRGMSAGRDSTTSLLQKLYKYAQGIQKIYSVVASFINSNDDMIGNAVESVTIGEYYTGYNWVLKGESGRTNGYVNLQMR